MVEQAAFLFLVFSLTPADLHLVWGGRAVDRHMANAVREGSREGSQDRKRKAFYNILRYSERRSQGFFCCCC